MITLLAGGVTGALVAVDSAAQLFATGYGRVLLPAAKSHRVTVYVSRARALTELAIMTVALTMAAALSVTG